MTPQLTLAIQPIHKGNRTLSNLEPHRLGADHHLHLEAIPLTNGTMDDLIQDILLIQPKAASQITDTGHQHNIGNQVCRARRELAEEVPAVDAALDIAAARVAGAGDDVGVGLLLDLDHLRDEFRVVAEVGVHDNHKVAAGVLQAVDVRGAEAEFARARLEHDVLGAPEPLQLFGDLERAVRGAVVHDDDFPVQVAGWGIVLVMFWFMVGGLGRECVLFSEGSFKQPADNREVPPLVVGRQNNGILVLFRGHFG